DAASAQHRGLRVPEPPRPTAALEYTAGNPRAEEVRAADGSELDGHVRRHPDARGRDVVDPGRERHLRPLLPRTDACPLERQPRGRAAVGILEVREPVAVVVDAVAADLLPGPGLDDAGAVAGRDRDRRRRAARPAYLDVRRRCVAERDQERATVLALEPLRRA